MHCITLWSKCLPSFNVIDENCWLGDLDARPTGDQEVAGLTPARSATFFQGDLIMKYFLVILSLRLIQEEQLSVSGERMCTILVKPVQ